MKKPSPPKSGSATDELLMPWLLRVLDEERFKGMHWIEKSKKFCIPWTHRSAEKWSETEIEVQKAWAIHKGNNIDLKLLENKSEDPAIQKVKSNVLKKLKATFRCALNSKKELELYHKTKTHRYWEIINPSQIESSKENKKKPKKLKPVEYVIPEQVQCQNVTSSNFFEADDNFNEDIFEMPNEMSGNNCHLPSFSGSFRDSFPLTPPHQASDQNIQILKNEEVNTFPTNRNILTPPIDNPMDDLSFLLSPDSKSDQFSYLLELGGKNTVVTKCEKVPSPEENAFLTPLCTAYSPISNPDDSAQERSSEKSSNTGNVSSDITDEIMSSDQVFHSKLMQSSYFTMPSRKDDFDSNNCFTTPYVSSFFQYGDFIQEKIPENFSAVNANLSFDKTFMDISNTSPVLFNDSFKQTTSSNLNTDFAQRNASFHTSTAILLKDMLSISQNSASITNSNQHLCPTISSNLSVKKEQKKNFEIVQIKDSMSGQNTDEKLNKLNLYFSYPEKIIHSLERNNILESQEQRYCDFNFHNILFGLEDKEMNRRII